MRSLHQQPPQQLIRCLADPQFRLTIPAVPLLARHSQVRSHVPAMREPLRIFDGQNVSQRDQRSYAVDLPQQLHLRVPFPDLFDILLIYLDLFGDLFSSGRIVSSLSPSASDSFT